MNLNTFSSLLVCSGQMFMVVNESYFKNKCFQGEKLEREEVDILIKECCDPEDDDGFIPYERKQTIVSRKMDSHFN